MCLQICIASLLTSSFVSCSSDADQALEKGRTIDGDVGENVSLVVSLFCSTSLWGFKVFEHYEKKGVPSAVGFPHCAGSEHYETKYFFPHLLCVIVSSLKNKKRVKSRKQPREQGLTKMLKIGS